MDSPLAFVPAMLPNVRIDSAGEDLAAAVNPGRAADGTNRFNLGLRGVETSLGRDASGKERLAYRPISNAEVGSNQNARELAARHNLTPIESGRYRSLR